MDTASVPCDGCGIFGSLAKTKIVSVKNNKCFSQYNERFAQAKNVSINQ